MPPKQSASAARGRPVGKAGVTKRKHDSAPFGSSPPPDDVQEIPSSDDDESEETPAATIPPDLLTRMLHHFFEKEGTRISKDANAAVAKYVDVFVREAIARAAAEKQGGFLEVSLLRL